MKKLLFLGLILLFSGCSTFQTIREVHDNAFISNVPAVNIKVNPDFKYLGDIGSNHDGTTPDGSYDLRYNYDSFCFVDIKQSEAERVLAIQIETISTRFVSDFWRKVKKYADKGKVKCSGKTFQYFTVDVHPTMDSDITRQISSKGYTLPYGLMRAFGKIYGVKGNHLVKLYYYEPIDNSVFNNRSWNNPDELTPKQRAFLNEFNKRAIASFEVIE